MTTEPKRLRTRRSWLLAAALLAGLGLAPILSAPDVAATCAKILGLAGRAGEPSGADEREACETRYDALRSSDGALRWTWRSWCTALAPSIPEAGEC